jgi:carboxylate-amine ligase
MKPPSLTLGVEEEYQIVDPKTRALKSYIGRIMEQELPGDVDMKPELHQSIVEVGTRPCATPAELRAELTRLRGAVMGFVGEGGLTIASAGSHPFSTWWEQDITPLERYEGVRRDMGDLRSGSSSSACTCTSASRTRSSPSTRSTWRATSCRTCWR